MISAYQQLRCEQDDNDNRAVEHPAQESGNYDCRLMLAEHRLNRQFCSQSFSRAHFFEDRRLLQPLSEQGSANTKNSTEQKCDAPADARDLRRR
jgi:hypothetical protein